MPHINDILWYLSFSVWITYFDKQNTFVGQPLFSYHLLCLIPPLSFTSQNLPFLSFDLSTVLAKPGRRQWHPTPVLLPGKSHGWRSLVGCSPWGRWESDTTEWHHFHFSLSCIGEGNGNPLQCSCLENPRDGGAWWAAIFGVAQSRTRLKWLSIASFGSAIYW